MATLEENKSVAATLTPGVVDTVTLDNALQVKICKRTSAGEMWVAVNPEEGVDPTVGGPDLLLLPEGVGEREVRTNRISSLFGSPGNTVVKLISDSAISYWVAVI